MSHNSRRKPPGFIATTIFRVEKLVNKHATFLKVVIVCALVLLVGMEIDEFELNELDAFHIAEILIYFLLLVGIVILLDAASRASKVQPIHRKQVQLKTMLLQKIETSLTKFTKFFRLAIAAVLVLLVGVETAEFQFRISDTFHIGEIIIYFILLSVLGLLVEVVLQAHKKQQRSINLLQYKHRMSLEHLPYQNWDSLTALLTKQLAELLDAQATYLFFNTSSSEEFEPVAEWVAESFETSEATKPDCLICVKEDAVNKSGPHYGYLPNNGKNSSEPPSYCYPIFYKDELYAVFRFILKPGRTVTDEQQELLVNISDEIIISLMSGQDRKRITELELAEIALAERHAMSHYLHDNLGQNLGYLRMKLDQFVNQPALLNKESELLTDLKRMKDVADESYRFVRNKLEVSIPESTPLLMNYLQEHAKKVASRSSIEIKFMSQGTPKAVTMDLQRAVFFVFQEALSNVEKHARAEHVDVLLDWCENQLLITVTDNGIGFDVLKVSNHKHFGLEIMRERMTGIGGSVEILSTKSIGTTIKMTAPIPAGHKKERATHG